MSTKYTGGFITKSPVAPTTTAASGIWTLDQQQQAQKAGTWPSPPVFIEDLFSTYLVTGDGTAPAVNNGIDVSGQGGLVWIKKRSAAGSNSLFDTARGANLRLISNDTAAQDSVNLSFTSTGFSNYTFDSAVTYVSWTFREQPKFFDIVTYTGNATAGRTIAHNLGAVPGCIIVKQTGGGGSGGVNNWFVYHRSLGATQAITLESTGAAFTSSSPWNNTTPTSTVFTVGGTSDCNDSGGTYVAYLFAHDAGGFPVSGGGSTNGITCGSYTGNGSTSGPEINLGYEAQWVMVKNASATGDWVMMDTMRGMTVSASDSFLLANTSDAESTGSNRIAPYANGFYLKTVSTSLNAAGNTYIYIAIRRGPMKPPTVGTSVFSPVAATTKLDNNSLPSAGFPIDMSLIIDLAVSNKIDVDRLRGKGGGALLTDATNSELFTTYFNFDAQTNLYVSGTLNSNVIPYVFYNFRRAPGYFDEVCYTGTSSARTITHNLGVVPELMIVKCRSTARAWPVYAAPLGNTEEPRLNESSASGSSTSWNSTTPTSSVFSVSNGSIVNASGDTYVAYLFATVAGVSKVGSYTGTGALQTVNCGFTSGARFVLIKRTDSTGDWWTYDSARGITSGNDPYLYLNSSAAEVTGTNYVDTDTTGFQVTAAAPAGLNANGGTYIFLAIA